MNLYNLEKKLIHNPSYLKGLPNDDIRILIRYLEKGDHIVIDILYRAVSYEMDLDFRKKLYDFGLPDIIGNYLKNWNIGDYLLIYLMEDDILQDTHLFLPMIKVYPHLMIREKEEYILIYTISIFKDILQKYKESLYQDIIQSILKYVPEFEDVQNINSFSKRIFNYILK